MNWIDITNAFRDSCESGKWPNIKAYTDEGVYILNDRENWHLNYATVILDLQNAEITDNYTTFNVMLWYIDRQERGRKDINNIISDAIATLGEMSIYTARMNDFALSSSTATPFQDRFADECAGASLSLSITIPNNPIC